MSSKYTDNGSDTSYKLTRSSPTLYGKKIILSNINVHREQNPKRGIYFNPNNYNKLTSIMIDVWKNYNKKDENKFNKIAYKNLKPRLIAYARNYQKIILKLAQS